MTANTLGYFEQPQSVTHLHVTQLPVPSITGHLGTLQLTRSSNFLTQPINKLPMTHYTGNFLSVTPCARFILATNTGYIPIIHSAGALPVTSSMGHLPI
jgi:hypothetical protein